jgi:hypothetical protein
MKVSIPRGKTGGYLLDHDYNPPDAKPGMSVHKCSSTGNISMKPDMKRWPKVDSGSEV